MPLSEPAALDLRDGDIVLVPMRVERTNNHFDTGVGVKCLLLSPELPPMSERGKEGPKKVEIYSRFIHEVHHRAVRSGDWVSCGELTGKITVILDDYEVVVRVRQESTPASRVFQTALLERIDFPKDLTPDERKVFN